MIVKMKKAFLVVLDKYRGEALKRLRKLGALHIDAHEAESATLQEHFMRRAVLTDALSILEGMIDKKTQLPEKASGGVDCHSLSNEILEADKRKQRIGDEISGIRNRIDAIVSWGDFNPEDLGILKEKGCEIKFFEIPESSLKQLSSEATCLVLDKSRKIVKIALINTPSALWPGEPVTVPDKSITGFQNEIAAKEKELAGIESQLTALMKHIPDLKEAIAAEEKDIEFHEIFASMKNDEALTFLSGYIPVDKTPALKKEAADNGWGLVLNDPSDEDPVPTLIKTPKWVGIIKPVFDFLGAMPGYKEHDISFWFLLFFSLFFAMIIGDAGYGAIMLVLTLVARLKMRKAPATPFTLLFVMSVATVIWGTLTGTWFGSDILAENAILKSATLPWIASFPDPKAGINTVEFIMNLCFLIGAVHLTIARIISFIKKMPSLAAFEEPGWISLLWGLYFLIRNIVLQKELYFLSIWLIGIGFAFVVIFSEQKGKFFKGLAIGLATSPLKVLNAIGGFSDIISYVRLFAVGLATVEVAKAFNTMVAGIGFGTVGAGITSALILFLGHALNIIMGAMSIIVHGVRLNMLEFSGHLGMEWAGREYKPFKE